MPTCKIETKDDDPYEPTRVRRASRLGWMILSVGCLFFSQARADQAEVPPMPARRAPLAPLDSPPFPSGEWVGASPAIGVPDTTPDYPFQKYILRGLLDGSRIKIYGWLNPSVNLSTSKRSNVPDAYDVVPNSVQLDQLVLRVERMPDSVQSDHVDWGFRFSNFYGIDYRYTAAKGWFSDQLLKKNRLYGYDPIEAYALLYIPWVASGMMLKVGRYISPPDIEAQLAPDNYLFSHSLMFSYDPFTFTGLTANVKLNEQWSVLLGLHAGNDMAPWTSSAHPNVQAMVRWVSSSNDDSLWAGINSLGVNRFRDGHDDLRIVAGTWGHRFNSRLHMMTEAYYQGQYDGALGGSCNDGPVRSYGGGGGCGPVIPGFSWSIGLVNYFQILLTSSDYLSIRNDALDDPQGQRTGVATWYSSHTIGWVHAFGDLLTLRPEIRYERAYAAGVTPYDLGTRRFQFSGGLDAILRF